MIYTAKLFSNYYKYKRISTFYLFYCQKNIKALYLHIHNTQNRACTFHYINEGKPGRIQKEYKLKQS